MNLKPKLRLRRKKRVSTSTPGTAPGTIDVAKHKHAPKVSAVRYSESIVKWLNDTPVNEVPPTSHDQVVWVDVVGMGDETILRQIADKFSIRDLFLEDVVNTYQRPKIDIVDDKLFIIVRLPTLSAKNGIDLEQVSIFVGDGFVVTFQERPGDCFESVRDRIKNKTRQVRHEGSDFLAYALVDAVVDSYFPIVHAFGDLLENIEDELITADSRANPYVNSIEFAAMCVTFDALPGPIAELVHKWLNYDGPLLGDSARVHLNDVWDHTIRVVELLENCRESCSDLRDLHMNATSMRMNEVMKVLTVIATIFIPLSFIAGLYGMNFSIDKSPLNMPETQWYYGYPMALAMMIGVAVTMLYYFRRKGWIGH